MKTLKVNRVLGKSVFALCCLGALAATSAKATLVTWSLNPASQHAPVGSSSKVFTVSGYSITAYGFDNVTGPDPARNLFYKNEGAGEFGLGLVGTPNNELQVGGNGLPAQYIQLDLTSILAQGFTNGQIEVGSIQVGESFVLYGSNTLGTLGTQIGGTFGSTFEEMFVNVPNFGMWNYISVGAGSGDVLPVAFQANITPVPEASTFFPILGLLVAVSSTQLLRRRQLARVVAKV